MGSLSVIFDVPRAIEIGLATGTLERVGGVIVDATSRQVVSWLRDGSMIEQAVNIGTGLPTPLGVILTAARTALSLYDGKLTRDAIAEVSHQVQTVTTIASFTATGQILNLALTAATFRAMMRRLDQLTDEVARLGELVQGEFQRERDTRFKMALQAARDVFESEATLRENAMRSAVDGLYEARENFLIDFWRVLERERTTDNLLMAQHYLVRAMYAEVSRVRCYLASDQAELARRRLIEDKPQFEKGVQELVRAWLGEKPAIYFHESVSPENLDRFVQVQRWLYRFENADLDTSRVLFQIIDQIRPDFWKTELIQDEYDNVIGQLARRPVRTFDKRMERLTGNLNYAEAAVENYERLKGFELELRSMRLEFSEWNRLVSEDDIAQHGLALVVDDAMLERLSQV